MKTITCNPKKEIMNSITVLIFLFSILTTINGQNSNTTIAMISTDNYLASSEVSAATNSMADEDLESEPANEVENWMLSNKYWRFSNFTEEIEEESTLPIESWMTSDKYFGLNNPDEITESETPLQIEKWMNSDKYFGYSDQPEEYEEKLSIEPWMNSNDYWTGNHEDYLMTNLADN